MRRILAFLFAILPLTSQAQDLSSDIAVRGLAAVESDLTAMPVRDAGQEFALGGVMFLRGIEKLLQIRYTYGLSPQLTMIPVLRLPIPENKAPKPFRAEVPSMAFADLASDMAAARRQLAAVPEGADFGVMIRPGDIWFDIDQDGRRGEREGLFNVIGPVMMSRIEWDPVHAGEISVRFDLADTHWLAAYAALIEGVSDVILTYDPTQAIADVIAANTDLDRISAGTPMANGLDMMMGDFVDAATVVIRALNQEPSRDKAAAALAAFRAMIAENRVFWQAVGAETDDEAEWIPGDRQHAALGFAVPEGTGAVWLAVLDDADALLDGRLLMPFWRLGKGAGLNLGRMFTEPRAVDPVAWVQGIAAIPYAEQGPRITPENWRRFDQMMEGRGLLFAALLN